MKLRYYRQQKIAHQTKSEEYQKMEETKQKQLNFIRQEQKEIAQEAENKKKESRKLTMKIIKTLETQKKLREKQLAQAYEE